MKKDMHTTEIIFEFSGKHILFYFVKKIEISLTNLHLKQLYY